MRSTPTVATSFLKAESVRIVIADDHEIFRRGLRSLLESHRDWEVCGEAVDGQEAVERVRELKPDVVVWTSPSTVEWRRQPERFGNRCRIPRW